VSRKPTIAIIGAGNLAGVLAQSLHHAGYRIDEIISRPARNSRRHARKLAEEVGATPRSLSEALLQSDVVWLCISDDAIAGCAHTLSRRREWKGTIALHSSGALSSELLAPLRSRGAAVGSLHPMMTFVRGGRARQTMQGVWFGVEGDAAAVRVARRIVRDLGGSLLTVRKENKALYHALGSFSSPMVVATLALAERIAREAGIRARSARAIMAPIVRRTLDNYLENGAAAAFSGPLARGDVTTIREHVKALRRVPGALDVYRALVRSALGSLPMGNRRRIEALLKR
jgi:predicted short-subunit dehydrogenase-like oxidoreductase (DUF2520 family)